MVLFQIKWSQLLFALAAGILFLALPHSVSATDEVLEKIDRMEMQAVPASLHLSAPPQILNYQGFLTLEDGTPFTQTVAIQASLWNAPLDGDLRWGPESFTTVTPANGLFQLSLGSTEKLAPALFQEALWVEIQIGAETMPRQPLHPAPYAFNLLPGAHISNSNDDLPFVVEITNQSPEPESGGLRVFGTSVAIVAETEDEFGLGIYSSPAIESAAGFRGPNSKIYISPTKGRSWEHLAGDSLFTNILGHGILVTRSNAPGTRFFYLPIDVPSILYGQEVTIESISVDYKIQAGSAQSPTRIAAITLERLVNVDESVAMTLSQTSPAQPNFNSRTPEQLIFTVEDGFLGADSGAPVLRFELEFANNMDFIVLGSLGVETSHRPGR